MRASIYLAMLWTFAKAVETLFWYGIRIAWFQVWQKFCVKRTRCKLDINLQFVSLSVLRQLYEKIDKKVVPKIPYYKQDTSIYNTRSGNSLLCSTYSPYVPTNYLNVFIGKAFHGSPFLVIIWRLGYVWLIVRNFISFLIII